MRSINFCYIASFLFFQPKRAPCSSVLFFLLDLLEHQFKDLKQGEDREAEEEAKVASNVGHKVVLGVDLEVGVDLYIRGKLKSTLSKRIIE